METRGVGASKKEMNIWVSLAVGVPVVYWLLAPPECLSVSVGLGRARQGQAHRMSKMQSRSGRIIDITDGVLSRPLKNKLQLKLKLCYLAILAVCATQHNFGADGLKIVLYLATSTQQPLCLSACLSLPIF